MTTRGARLVRGWLTASIAVFVAAFAHAAAGGNRPGALGTMLALVFSGLVCTFLAGKSLSLFRMSASVLVSQFLFHVLFGLGGGTGVALTVVAGSHHGSVTVIPDPHAAMGSMGLTSSGTAVAASAQMDAWMWLAHVGAALVTIIALRHGEAAFRMLSDLVGLLASYLNTAWHLHDGLLIVVPHGPGDCVPRNGSAALTDFGVLRSSVWRRGPPRALPSF
ncbi:MULTISPECIES: hypothetical protein [unclassified Cryobacterium]|uniref:hypothetical protein n=1 Tax=unclassified Cryobacterium TaxID=2649013 RepID=UPI00106C6D2C|nr:MULTISPECIES: hypothetical protein [unclassified Cryobacterium]TFB93544.1 hypothetical protein E3O39_16090 [Cryobacterium sp. MDB2-A-1]TFC10071.1 hypothetical protein E3O59_03645 [Cryobacterium sp. MDB2-33-2]TFC11956.1 hypothetical protein E3O35_10480 [Cryobacterium sp. MDB2-A-2]TFC13480.1 hypothetical protein E3O51_17680 [Cryobacterium sp. MDB2-10]